MAEVLNATRRAIDAIRIDVDSEIAKVKLETANRIEREVRPPPSEDGSVDGDAMEAYLDAVRQALERALLESTGTYSAAAWLWYLRNSPPQIVGGGSKTAGLHVQALSEAVTAGATGTGRDPDDSGWDAMPYPVDETVMMAVIRLSAISHLLLFIHERIRLNRRGAGWTMDGPWPAKSLTPALEHALERYDRRNALAQHRFLNRTGTVFAAPVEGEIGDPGIAALSVLPAREQGVVEARLGRRSVGDAIYSTHAVQPFLLDRLRDFNSGGPEKWWSQDARSLLTLLVALHPVADASPSLVRDLQATGVWLVRADEFEETLSRAIEAAGRVVMDVLPGDAAPASPGDLLESLSRVRGRLWPVEPFDVVRREAAWVAIDVAAACRALDAAFEFSRGQPSGTRDAHFERSIQWAIDRTAWRPQGDLRAIPGKDLKVDGKVIAEVDAVAAKGAVLIVADGRGTAYTRDFETGDRNTVSTAADQLQEKVSRMATRLHLLTRSKKGSNYDFSAYDQILGLVITAVPIYTSREDTWAEQAPGLLAIVSLGELVRWLEGH